MAAAEEHDEEGGQGSQWTKWKISEEGHLHVKYCGRLVADESDQLRADESGQLRADESGQLRAGESGQLRADESGRLRADESGQLRAGESGQPPFLPNTHLSIPRFPPTGLPTASHRRPEAL